jgi:hypothetical protein
VHPASGSGRISGLRPPDSGSGRNPEVASLPEAGGAGGRNLNTTFTFGPEKLPEIVFNAD